MKRMVLMSAWLAMTMFAAPARACQVTKIVTPDDLVRDADSIYRARAEQPIAPVSAAQSSNPLLPSGKLRFEVLQVLKGVRPSGLSIEVKGDIDNTSDPSDRPVPYDFVRPGGRHGNCIAGGYKIGQEYLLFLKGGSPYWSALMPTNEQVSGNRDPWVKWVESRLAKRKPRPAR